MLATLFCLANFGVFVKAEEIEISIVGEAYGSSIGSANWNPEADLNNDGIVNVYDLALASKGDSVTSPIYGPLQGGTTTISVEPLNTSVGSVGKNFSIKINITDALDTWAWQFRLKWNPSVLKITNPNFTEGDFLSQGGTWNTYPTFDMNQTEGWIIVGNTLLEEPTSYPEGNGTLAIIYFNVLSTGDSTLHLNDTFLLRGDGVTSYEHNTGDGYFIVCSGDINRDGEVDNIDLGHFASAYGSSPSSANWNVEADFNNNGIIDVFDLFVIGRNYGKTCTVISGESSSATKLYVEPEKISAPLATNTTFDVNLSMDYVENLYAYKFKLKYDPNVLSATKMTYSYLNSPVQVWKNTIDNSKGEIQFEINSYIGAKPKTGKGSLATVTFQVKDLGKTDIDIFSSKLGDVKKLVGHDTEDGFFNNFIPATVDIAPNTLNLNDKGNWITVYVNLPLNYSVNNIDTSSVKLLYEDNSLSTVYGEVRNNTLVLKFDRASLQNLLTPSDNIELTVKGNYSYNSRYVDFIGIDSIKVISK